MATSASSTRIVNGKKLSAEREAESAKAYAPQVARNVASFQAQGKTAKELCGGGCSRNAEGEFRSCDARYICRRSRNADSYRRGNCAGDQMRSGCLVAEMAGLAIRAGFSAMIVPGGAADQRKYKQKRGEHGAEL
jgi:hypothetical protein